MTEITEKSVYVLSLCVVSTGFTIGLALWAEVWGSLLFASLFGLVNVCLLHLFRNKFMEIVGE